MTITTNTNNYVGAGIILTRCDNGLVRHLLLCGRETGVWSFSKGHPEPEDNETPLRTAARETYEETGLVAGQDYLIIGSRIRFGKRPYWLGLMLPGARPVKIAAKEHTAAAWLTPSEIAALPTAVANIDVRAWVKKGASETGMWQHTLRETAVRLGVPTLMASGRVTTQPTCSTAPVCSAS